MEQNFTINVSGEIEEGDGYSVVHVIITTFVNITPELVEIVSKTLEKRLPACETPITSFIVSQITDCNDLIYIQFSGLTDDFNTIKKFAESKKFYGLIEPVLTLFK